MNLPKSTDVVYANAVHLNIKFVKVQQHTPPQKSGEYPPGQPQINIEEKNQGYLGKIAQNGWKVITVYLWHFETKAKWEAILFIFWCWRWIVLG